MMASSIALLVFVLACTSFRHTSADEASHMKYVGQFRYTDYLISSPAAHFLSHYDMGRSSLDTELSTNVTELYSILGLSERIVVDVFSGWGISYFPLANLVGSSGIIVAIEIEQTYFDCLRNNTIDKHMWERTLLMHGDPRETKLGLRTAHSVSNVVRRIGLDCPRLVRINDHAGLKESDIFYGLIGGLSLINTCRPIVLVDCRREDPASATAIAEFFSLLGDGTGFGAYSMHWLAIEHTIVETLPDGESNSTKWTTAAMLAVPAELAELAAQLRNMGYESVKQHEVAAGSHENMWDDVIQYANQSELADSAEHSNACANTADQSCSRAPTADQPARIYEEAQISVHLRDIAASETPLGGLLGISPASPADPRPQEASKRLHASLVSQQLDTLSLTYRFSSGVSMNVENLDMIAVVHCGVWLQRLTDFFEVAQSDALQDGGDVAQACTSFVAKRLRTMRRIFALRALTLAYPDLVLDPKASTDTYFPGAQLEPAAVTTEHTYYHLSDGPHADSKLASAQVMRSWFERAPFKTKSDEAACGEPVWCSHTVEMQRRILAWQNPDKIVPTASPARSRAERDWSYIPRSCSSTKFLVYEPISNGQGIGSLLELVAATMRYAICLDRVLIVNFAEQQPTLQKWVHPGCQGSFVECYFQPLSSCVLSAEEIRAARSSHDGFEFDAYPQREERVLVLKGMPLEGKCKLCHSEWAAQSRFFDGLVVSEGTYNGSDKGHLKHVTAFLGSVKQTWASQFLRYIMRPRPWLQEAVSQIVHASMQSPVPATKQSGLASSANQSYISVEEFPRSFLSLHVRFGMKAAENALMPLSRYMEFIARKMPHVRDIFLSTETEAVIWTLRGEYPDYRFHALHYPRKEFLDLALQNQHIAYHQSTDYVDEMLFSLANLYVASEAQAFVGTLSSNWCMMIMHLERTRGDGGHEYFSMDEGSAYTSCY